MSYADQEIPDTGKFLKVKPGQTVRIHLLSKTPKRELIHGFGKDKETCAGETCNRCAQGYSPTVRFKMNVWDRLAKKEKEYECGPMVMGDIIQIAKGLREDDQTVHDVDIRISAYKDGEFTKYKTIHGKKGGDVPVPYKEGFEPLIGNPGKKKAPQESWKYPENDAQEPVSDDEVDF